MTPGKSPGIFGRRSPPWRPFFLPGYGQSGGAGLGRYENFERIAVYGDYDCDGVTSTALLYSYLETVGADVLYYIPDREGEGYGMNCGGGGPLAEQDVSLIITVDNGISAKEEIAYAASLGIDVVVTDHHQPPEELPPAVAVVDPHRRTAPAEPTTCPGWEWAFQLICALEGDDGGEMLDYYGDLVTIGLIGDVMELTRPMPRPGKTRAFPAGGERAPRDSGAAGGGGHRPPDHHRNLGGLWLGAPHQCGRDGWGRPKRLCAFCSLTTRKRQRPWPSSWRKTTGTRKEIWSRAFCGRRKASSPATPSFSTGGCWC